MNSANAKVQEVEDGPSKAALALIETTQRLAAIDKEMEYRNMRIMTESIRGELAKITEALHLVLRLLQDKN